MKKQTQFTQALTALDVSDIAAGETPEELLAAIYDELRGIASGYLRQERADHTLQPTALVHEAYSRLVNQTQVPWSDAAHFRAITARVMRQVLIDHARKHNAIKRGGDRVKVTLSDTDGAAQVNVLDLLELDEAMEKLRELDARKAQVVELLFFGGMTHKEAARIVGVSQKTIEADWYMARAWLGKQLRSEANDGH
ncbi:MAG: sigma-70 family RNA polymerase sigma factor [Phycisphaerales bacterium]|nr:sigma-70 family RNA polymerase sigma factor [Phycisphaerales bacterium]